jgi:hypothetical protein
MPNDKMSNGKKCRKDKKNVEWDKMLNGHNVESKKGQMGQNAKWKSC